MAGKYGIYVMSGDLKQADLNPVTDIAQGAAFRFRWTDIETTRDVYDFTQIKKSLDIANTNGKPIWVQLNISPNSTANPSSNVCPLYLFSAPDSVPKVFTSNSTDTYYPYYMNANFIARHEKVIDKFIEFLSTLSYKNNIKLLLSAEGKTGDPDPYKGTPTNPAYVISSTDWDIRKKALWSYQVSKLVSYGLITQLMINPSNDGFNFQYGTGNISGCSLKAGDISHNYDFTGSINIALRTGSLRDNEAAGDYHNISGGEFENTQDLSYYTQNPKGYTLPFLAFNLAAGAQIVRIAPQKMLSDHWAYAFYNEFADYRDVSESDKGFILFRDKIDLGDTERFPESTFDPVIDPSRLSGPNGYTQKYTSVINSTLPDAVKSDNITSLRVSYFNPSRLTKIFASFSGTGANYVGLTSNRDFDTTNDDYGLDVLPGNFERFAHMYDPLGTSEGEWRINYTGFDGRYVRRLTDAKPAWSFYTELISSGDYQTKVKVRYSNSGTGSFQLMYFNGTSKVSAGLVTCTNTNVYIEKEFTITHFVGGRKLAITGTADKCDFTIEKVGTGDAIDFSLLRFYRLTQNAVNILPVADAGSNQTITLPTSSVILTGIGTDSDGAITAYAWSKISGPSCTIVSPTSATTNVTGLSAGIYVFQFLITDNSGGQDSATVTVTVNASAPPNLPPVAEAGANQTIILPTSSVSLSGSGSTDSDGTIVFYSWTKISGPATYTITAPSSSSTNITGLVAGTYVFQLLVTDDDGATDTDTITIVVLTAANTPPVAATASATYSITLPVNSVDLDFTGSTDPDGSIVGRTTARISGPTTYLPINPGTATPTISEMIAGVYVFRHTVTDNDGGTDYVDVTITVNAAVITDPQPPNAVITPPETNYTNVTNTFSSRNSFDNDGTIVSRLWSMTGPVGFTLDDTTAEDVNILVTQPGIYQLTLLITDNDDLTDETTLTFEAADYVSTDIIPYGLPKLEWLYFIVDKDLRSATIDNGTVVFNVEPTPFKQHPEGWKDFTVSFGTNEKYFSLNRSFSLPLKFVGDAAEVLRNRAYNGKGYEEELYVMIFRWDRETGIHKLEYKGKIDLLEMEDIPLEGVIVNTIEGGILSYLNANDSKTYEIAGDETNPDIKKVKFDGINLEDTIVWNTFEFTITNGVWVYPLVFLNTEGDSVGLIFGSQTPEEINSDAYYTDSKNYAFSSVRAVSFNLKSLRHKINIEQNDAGTYSIDIKLRSSLGQEISVYNATFSSQTGDIYFDINEDITLEANENLFLVVSFFTQATADRYTLTIPDSNELDIYIITRNDLSLVYADTLWGLFKKLIVAATESRYIADSTFFAAHDNIAAFCGDALRNTSRSVIPFYKMATNVSDCFKALNSIYNIGMKIVDDVLNLEPKADIYNDTDNVLLDLGEVSEIKIRYTKERIVNTVKCGYEDQDYSQRNGKYEFNTSRQYGLPVVAAQREYDITCPYRGDAFGQEFIRDVLENKDSTDNTGDKNVFIAVIDDTSATNEQYLADNNDPQVYASGDLATFETFTGDYFTPNTNKDQFTFSGNSQTASANVYFNIDNDGAPISVALLKNGVSIQSQFIAAAVGDDFDFDVTNIPLAAGDILSVSVTNPGSTLTSTIIRAQLTVNFTSVVYELSRTDFDSFSGVLDNSVYNTEISPLMQLLAHGNYLKGLLHQLQDKEITFQTGSKNVLFSRTIDGVTYTENENIPVANLLENFFISYEIEIKVDTPYTFSETLARMNAGLVKCSFNGYDIYGLPIGEMTAKPATDEPQVWKLLAHKNTSPSILQMLGSPGTFIGINNSKMIFLTDTNPVHFVKYNYSPNAKYHQKDMYDDWTHNRHERFAAQPAYLQKWQKNDTINLQIITSGLGQIELYVYDKNGDFVQSYPFIYDADAAVIFPATKQQLTITLADYEEGEYIFVIRSATTDLLISEWLSIKEDHADTFLYEYYNTFNKLDSYWGTWRPSIRCEGFMHVPQPDSSFVTYEDEPGDLEMLHGRPTMKRILTIGNALGVPDWMANKMNRILLLNRVSIDGVRYTRNADSKMEAEEREGYPLNFYRVEIRKALNEDGITINDEGAEVIDGITAYTLDAKAFGRAENTITIITRNE